MDGLLEILFEHFNNLLKKENNYLIIFIDALNELGEEKAKHIKNEIEDFLYALTNSVINVITKKFIKHIFQVLFCCS